MKKILVIEDNAQHHADAKEFFGKIEGFEFIFAKNFTDAVCLTEEEQGDSYAERTPNLAERLKRYDGIITDLHFPIGNMVGNHPNSVHQIGIGIMLTAFYADIPCVAITDQNHHGEGLQWITTLYRLCGERKYRMCDVDWLKDGKKDWDAAWEYLLRIMG
jgi:hypothetical protein